MELLIIFTVLLVLTLFFTFRHYGLQKKIKAEIELIKTAIENLKAKV